MATNNSGNFGTGTAGQVLTSNGAGVNPTFQAAPSGNITITGDSGGGLTGTSFTFTGGTTGLTFAGAGTTETLGGTLAIANGGTNATSMSTSTGIVKYDGTRLVTSSTAKISASNIMTNTAQPAFSAYLSTSPTNVTGDGTAYQVVFDTAFFDQASNYNTGTGFFTAPVTGKYFFQWTCYADNISAQTTIQMQVVTTAQTFNSGYFSPVAIKGAGSAVDYGMSVFCSMSASDTASFVLIISGGTKTIGIFGNPGLTYASGHLVC